MTPLKIKKQLVEFIIKDLDNKIHSYEDEMKKAQKEANSHIGAMESRYDTFKEEAQMLTDGFARQRNLNCDLCD